LAPIWHRIGSRMFAFQSSAPRKVASNTAAAPCCWPGNRCA
jgi:hypothetical protein